MDSRKLAALLASLISQIIVFLLHLDTLLSFQPSSSSSSILFPILHHFLSSHESAASFSLISNSRKRKRTHLESELYDEEKEGDACAGFGSCRIKLGINQNPDSFKNCFKMNSSTFEWLSGLLEPLLECRDPIGSPLNLCTEFRLGIGLFRLATGSDYPDIARRFGVSESAARFCTKQLCRVLCTNFRFWVAFPSELESVSLAFEDLTGLPNCCGVIGCTRFRIVNNDENQKRNEDSIAVQVVVDSSNRILSIVAGFRGDKGDSMVLKLSTLYKDIEEGRLLNSPPVDVDGVSINQYLVGDGGYPLLPWLMVPFSDAQPGSCEENFNASHNLIRLSALRTVGSLKNWGVLSGPIQEEVKAAVAYIGACSILHNVLLMREDFSALSDAMVDYSSHNQSFQYYPDNCLEGNSIERNASAIRSVLVKRVRNLNSSN